MNSQQSREMVIHLLKTRQEFYGLAERERTATMECVRLAEAWDKLKQWALALHGGAIYRENMLWKMSELTDDKGSDMRTTSGVGLGSIAERVTWRDEMGKVRL